MELDLPFETCSCVEVAQYLGISESSVRRWIRRKMLRATKVGAFMYSIQRDDLLADLPKIFEAHMAEKRGKPWKHEVQITQLWITWMKEHTK